jgi:hypothetical protein
LKYFFLIFLFVALFSLSVNSTTTPWCMAWLQTFVCPRQWMTF